MMYLYKDEPLLLEPTPSFYKQEDEEKGKLKLTYLLGYLRPYRKFIIQLGLGMLTGSIITMLFPFLTQAVVDYGISNNDLAFIAMVLVAQMVLTFGQTANGLIRSWIMLPVTTRISISPTRLWVLEKVGSLKKELTASW